MHSDKTLATRPAAPRGKAPAPKAAPKVAVKFPAPKAAPKVAVKSPAPKAAPKVAPKAAPTVAAKTPKRMTIGKVAAHKAGRLSKAAFVRAQPLTVGAKEVVDAGAKLGLIMSPDYVHKVRSTAKAAGKKLAPKKAALKPIVAKSSPLATATVEPQFRKFVIEIGLARAKALISEVQNQFGASR